jgi:hypothetical protein
MTSKPRPIHTLHKPLREVPDESEPSYSYEETSFLAQKEDDVEDEFHRRFLASTTNNNNNNYQHQHHHVNTRWNGSNNNNNNNKNKNSIGGDNDTSSMDMMTPSTSRGPFWRTELTPQWQARGAATTTSTNTSTGSTTGSTDNFGNDHITSPATSVTSKPTSSQKQSSSSSSRKGGGGVMGRLIGRNSGGSGVTTGGGVTSGSFPKKDNINNINNITIPKRERKTSGGLLGAALQLHSQGNQAVNSEKTKRNSNSQTVVDEVCCFYCHCEDINISILSIYTHCVVIFSHAVCNFFLFLFYPWYHNNTMQHQPMEATTAYYTPQHQHHSSHPPPKRMSSSMSQNSVSSSAAAAASGNNNYNNNDGKGNKKDLTRQRAEARRLKMDAQIHNVDIGRREVEGDIPTTIGTTTTTITTSVALLEEDEGGATTDGESTTASNHLVLNNPSTYPVLPPGQNNMTVVDSDVPPVSSISTTATTVVVVPVLKDDSAGPVPPDNSVDHRWIGDNTTGSDYHDGITTTGISGSGKNLLYGKGPISATLSSVGAAALDHSGRNKNMVPKQIGCSSSSNSSSSTTTVLDQSNRSSGLGANVLFGKSSSLIFPTGVVDTSGGSGSGGGLLSSTTVSVATTSSTGMFSNTANNNNNSGGGAATAAAAAAGQKNTAELKSHKINLLLDQCETVRFPFKKKLMLNSLELTAADIPIKDLYRTNLGNSLHKLSLAGNRLSTIPPKLVVCLPVLKSLDLSQCELHQLPERWNLPQLKRLNLSHNKLTEFPEEVRIHTLAGHNHPSPPYQPRR